MATRMIVTSQPDVACDVCGRRLLRGEQPDVFLASGRRRTVCELCAPRASAEGWLRETDHHAISLPPARPRRGRNLLDRLRQQRERADPTGRVELPPMPEDPDAGGSYDLFDGGPGAAEPLMPDIGDTAAPVPAAPFSNAPSAPAEEALSGADATAARALEVFNAGEHPRRVAGVARSLGAPSVSVRAPAESGSAVVAIVVAWELSWYRYEVDLGDEATGASVVAQGTELSELAAEDRVANAAADADGALSLVASVPR
ncbi:MAG TPA: hypothetical protein VG053_08215 [Solirubrobacteraceae bacterium]|jgi:hypothetical protein|nr:hypothetical protein [Solirubrobacteraceae bacterium]